MSLFDIIKYASTDFRNEAEIRMLPEDLLDMLWADMFTGEKFRSYEYKVDHLVNCSSKFWYADIESSFSKVLKEYNNEPV